MIKTHRVKLKLTQSQFELVREKQMECANCWNEVVRISKEYYFENKKWISNYDIQKLIKGRYNLHSATIQAISDKFNANRKTIAELRKKGNTKAKYPYKEKKFYIIPFKASAINRNSKGNLKLSMSKGRYLELDFNIENIKTAEIVWRNGYYLYYTFDDGMDNPIAEGTNTIGVDLGEIHSIASMTNEGVGLIISNREGRSIKQFRNKMYAYISKRLSRCKKGSNFCVEQQVCEIVLGDIKGIEKYIKKKKKLNRINRQKISQMEYGRIKDYIKYKAKGQGIEVKLVKEHFTSQTCPKCSKKHKPTGRNYKCTCGYSTHRDIVGAWNILRKKHKCDLVDFSIIHKQPINLKVSTV